MLNRWPCTERTYWILCECESKELDARTAMLCCCINGGIFQQREVSLFTLPELSHTGDCSDSHCSISQSYPTMLFRPFGGYHATTPASLPRTLNIVMFGHWASPAVFIFRANSSTFLTHAKLHRELRRLRSLPLRIFINDENQQGNFSISRTN